MITILVVISLVVVWNIYHQFNPEIEKVLEDAGENRPELEAVLEHYNQRSSDSLKLKAAHFLIENMPAHYTTTSKQLDLFDSVFFCRLSELENLEYKYEDAVINKHILRSRMEKVWKRVVSEIGDPATFQVSRIPDQQTIKAKFLIENIDLAFEALKFPWARHLTFDQFCEYVLPYRFADELSESWRPFFMERYKWLIDSAKNESDPIEICKLINEDIGTWHQVLGGRGAYPRAYSASQLFISKNGGTCFDQAAIASFAMRSMGLAIARDQITHWGDRSLGHDFSSILTKDGKFIGFLGGEEPPGKSKINNKAPKIFRETFSVRQLSEKEREIELPLRFNMSTHIDVTKDYIPTSTIDIDQPKEISSTNGSAYLCIFNNKDWVPVYFAPLMQGKYIFNDMGRDIVYLPVFYKSGNHIQSGFPFLLAKDATIRFFVPDTLKKQTIKLYRKYLTEQWKIDFANQMIGGRFQGANKSDFSDASNLYLISSTPALYLQSQVVKEGKFRYLRYIFPPFSRDSVAGNIAEIGFKGFDQQGKESWLEGNFIGSPEFNKNHFLIAFNRKLDDYLNVAIADTLIEGFPECTVTIPYKRKLWIGLDLKKQYNVTQIGFCPRNDTNGIYDNCTYELFYWNKRWVSLGIKSSQDKCLTYTNVPSNSLLLLHNHTEGKEERIFIYENGKQVWW